MRETRNGILIFDTASKRYDIRFGLEEYYGGLCCGECFEVKVEEKWIPVRIELRYPKDWYLVGLSNVALSGLQVRI
ncbi:DUF5348 domain-containing protein [Clostridium sp. C105KSO13]|uniref:DUF5348 domain-containing protein n=1 Tax=Clostridium sp. C105KSO13 TaxID=1776045 RepID=UPI0007406B36|nr:DUF5348 domain-containing protein [Clostridium sp. C105KSO13]CUX25290.1 hypothetical protein BN3456_00804 [Clostridium sp. C105KSO13]